MKGVAQYRARNKSRYRKLDPRFWNDEKVRRLSDDGKLAFLFLLSHPHMTCLGAMRATLEGLASERRWPVEKLREALAPAVAAGMVEVNAEASSCVLETISSRFLRNTPWWCRR